MGRHGGLGHYPSALDHAAFCGRVAGAGVTIAAVDRKWLLKDVTTVIAQEDAYVADIRSDVRGDGRVQLRVRLRVADYGQLSALLGKLEALPGVERAWRLG